MSLSSVAQFGCQSEPAGFALPVLAQGTSWVCPACPGTGNHLVLPSLLTQHRAALVHLAVLLWRCGQVSCRSEHRKTLLCHLMPFKACWTQVSLQPLGPKPFPLWCLNVQNKARRSIVQTCLVPCEHIFLIR